MLHLALIHQNCTKSPPTGMRRHMRWWRPHSLLGSAWVSSGAKQATRLQSQREHGTCDGLSRAQPGSCLPTSSMPEQREQRTNSLPMTPHKFWDGLLPLRTTIQCTECCIESHHITGNLPRVHTGKDLEKRDKMGYTVLYKDDKANCVEDVEDVEDVEANMLYWHCTRCPRFPSCIFHGETWSACSQALARSQAETVAPWSWNKADSADVCRKQCMERKGMDRYSMEQTSASANICKCFRLQFPTWTILDFLSTGCCVEKYGKHETGQKATWHGLSRAAVADDVGLKLKLASSLKQIKSTLRAKAGSGGGKCKAELSEHWRKQQTQAPDFPICLPCHMHWAKHCRSPERILHAEQPRSSSLLQMGYGIGRKGISWAKTSKGLSTRLFWTENCDIMIILRESYSMYDIYIYTYINITIVKRISSSQSSVVRCHWTVQQHVATVGPSWHLGRTLQTPGVPANPENILWHA